MHKGKLIAGHRPFSGLGRTPERERIAEQCMDVFRRIAEFYRFEKATPAFIEEAEFFMPLIKAGVLTERHPIGLDLKSDHSFFLRFSGALSLIRAYVTEKMNDLPHPLRFFYEAPSFSLFASGSASICEHEEAGLLMIGEEGSVAEAEIVLALWKALAEIVNGPDLELVINATGCGQCRAQFRPALSAYLRSRAGRLCKTCKGNIRTAPTRIFLCTEEKCMSVATHAPQILDYICDSCKRHLKGFLEFLDEIEIPYFLDTKLFREGEWFNLLIFEIVARAQAEVQEEKKGDSWSDGGRILLGEGGRLSHAGELLVGKKLDVVSGVLFLEAIETYLVRVGPKNRVSDEPNVFLAQLGEFAKRKSLRMLETLRLHGIETRESLGRDSIKSQLKVAETLGVSITLILGQKEALDETIIIREMESGIQEVVPQEKLIEFLKRKLKK